MADERDSSPQASSIQRRRFLQTAGLAGAALVAPTGAARAQSATPEAAQRGAATPLMTAAAEATPPADVQILAADERSGSDFMVDVIKSLDFDYICANPGSSFRGLHESIINYGGNTKPELITCMHEESSVAMAHGYFKVEGKPLAVMAHGTVGLQHAAMALYNAWCDRVPVYMIIGNHGDAALAPRRGVVPRRAGRGAHGARLHEVGRHAVVAHALRRIGRARVQDRDDAADGAGRARARRQLQEEPISRGGAACDSEAHAARAAAGRVGRGRRSRRGCSSRPRTRCSSPTASRARRTA